MIEIRVEFNGKSKLTLHPVEERDVKVVDLALQDEKMLLVKKVGPDYILTPYTPGEENDTKQ